MIKLGKEQPVASMDQSSGKVRCRAKRGKHHHFHLKMSNSDSGPRLRCVVSNRSTTDQIIANWQPTCSFKRMWHWKTHRVAIQIVKMGQGLFLWKRFQTPRRGLPPPPPPPVDPLPHSRTHCLCGGGASSLSLSLCLSLSPLSRLSPKPPRHKHRARHIPQSARVQERGRPVLAATPARAARPGLGANFA